MKKRTLVAASILGAIFTNPSIASGPTVSGNVISWVDPGWHQVQEIHTLETMCEGGHQCTVPSGEYIVINFGSGERFEHITVEEKPRRDGPRNRTLAPVAKTGQVVSYAFGDDGDYQSGVSVTEQRFKDNRDGTFTDELTGLVWMGIRDCIVKKDWLNAINYANTMSARSYHCPGLRDGSVAGDWRLPNIKELYSLVDISDNSPVWAEGIPYSGNNWSEYPWSLYWSSSSFEPASRLNGWALNADFGQTTVVGKDSEEFVWIVR